MKKFVLALMLLAVMACGALAAETVLPVSYDLREHNIVPSVIRDQGNYGLCWAFGTLAAMESNYMLHLSNDNIPSIPLLNDGGPDNPHTSELFLGWFIHHTKPGDEHLVFSVTSGDKRLLSLKELEQHPGIGLDTGGNWLFTTALMARGFGWGPIPHSELPYPVSADQNDAWLQSQMAAGRLSSPDQYTTVLLLTDVDAPFYPESTDANFISGRANIIRQVKELLMSNGVMSLRYMDVKQSRNTLYKTYYCSEADEARMKALNPKNAGGHIVALVGWDDTIPAASFDVQGRERPDMDGAWLIRNSWGDNDPAHDKGYFWMSYAQPNLGFQSFIVEAANKNLVCYDWDPLGLCLTWGEKGQDSYAVNVFKTGDQPVKLERISFYTDYYDNDVELYVKSDYGTTKPTEDTVALGNAVLTNYYYYYPGYHTYPLSADQIITIQPNSYFSVGLKIEKKYEKPIAVETRVKGESDYAEVFDGESFFSTDGKTWTDGTKMTKTDEKTGVTEVLPMNACIKAFVSSLTGVTEPQPEKAKEEQTINNKLWDVRPENTVSDAALMDANNPSGENAAILTGRNLSLFLLDNEGNPLAAGTEATLKFLFMGSDASYDMYFVPEDEGETDEDGNPYGYFEQPGEEWVREFYPDGYEPHDFVDDEGELYAAYVTTVRVGANGNVALSADAIPTDTEGHSIPVGYYDVFYVVSDDASEAIVGTLPIVEITASEPEPEPEPTPTPDPSEDVPAPTPDSSPDIPTPTPDQSQDVPTPTPTPTPTQVTGSPSGGCDAGMCGFVVLGLAVLLIKKRK